MLITLVIINYYQCHLSSIFLCIFNRRILFVVIGSPLTGSLLYCCKNGTIFSKSKITPVDSDFGGSDDDELVGVDLKKR